MTKNITVALILFLLLLVAGNCSKTQYGIVTARNGLILRSRPGIGSDRLDAMPLGSRVVVISVEGPRESLYKVTANWFNVSYNNMNGWAFGGFVKLLKSDLANAYLAKEENFVEFYEYKNKKFDMTVNLCQGVGTISGKYSYEDNYIVCNVKKIDFSGFLGDNISEFKFKISDNKSVVYNGHDIGCGPSNDMILYKFDK